MSDKARVEVSYAREPALSVEEFRDVLNVSSLGALRPVGDLDRLRRMLAEADIIVTARAGDTLVGVARAITDYSFCCYVSELAVDESYQRLGIGKCLIEKTRALAGDGVILILIAAPDAEAYYPKIGMDPVKSAWMIPRSR